MANAALYRLSELMRRALLYSTLNQAEKERLANQITIEILEVELALQPAQTTAKVIPFTKTKAAP